MGRLFGGLWAFRSAGHRHVDMRMCSCCVCVLVDTHVRAVCTLMRARVSVRVCVHVFERVRVQCMHACVYMTAGPFCIADQRPSTPPHESPIHSKSCRCTLNAAITNANALLPQNALPAKLNSSRLEYPDRRS